MSLTVSYISSFFLYISSTAYSSSTQRDDTNGAGTVCSPAHRPPGEPEEAAGNHEHVGGEAAADSGGLCDSGSYWRNER